MKRKILNIDFVNNFCLTLLLLIFVLNLIRCKDNEQLERRPVGKFIIEARFIDSSTIDGTAKYYDERNTLISIINYKNGIKDGFATNYYPNHILKDSTIFTSGLKNGFSYYYDSLGNLVSKQFNFYGCKAGDNIFYSSNKLYKYSFVDLNKDFLVQCTYDPSGKCKLDSFSIPDIVMSISGKNKGDIMEDSLMDFLIYFPKPPNLSITTTMGLINDKNQTKDEIKLNDDRLFLDTGVVMPPNDWYYYISRHVESKKDSINKLYIETFK